MKIQPACCLGWGRLIPGDVCNTRRGGCRPRPAAEAIGRRLPLASAALLLCFAVVACAVAAAASACFCLFVFSRSVVVSVVGRLLLCLLHPAAAADADGLRWERFGSGRPRESWVWWGRGSVLRLEPPSPSLLFLPHHCGSSGAWNKRARRDGKRDRAECSAGWSGWLAPGL